MQDYIVQLVISDNDENIYPSIYTEKIQAKTPHEALEALYSWTWTITNKTSDEFDTFEMYINGLTVNQFLNK